MVYDVFLSSSLLVIVTSWFLRIRFVTFIFFMGSRDLSELVGYNPPPPIMSREEFEARKADLKRKREMERREER